jgi:hypothetical protein
MYYKKLLIWLSKKKKWTSIAKVWESTIFTFMRTDTLKIGLLKKKKTWYPSQFFKVWENKIKIYLYIYIYIYKELGWFLKKGKKVENSSTLVKMCLNTSNESQKSKDI